jgi:hypothetical protein
LTSAVGGPAPRANFGISAIAGIVAIPIKSLRRIADSRPDFLSSAIF